MAIKICHGDPVFVVPRRQARPDLERELNSSILYWKKQKLTRAYGSASRRSALRRPPRFRQPDYHPRANPRSLGMGGLRATVTGHSLFRAAIAEVARIHCVAVVTLALGIGATTAIFTLVYDAMLRPLPLELPVCRTAEQLASPSQGKFAGAPSASGSCGRESVRVDISASATLAWSTKPQLRMRPRSSTVPGRTTTRRPAGGCISRGRSAGNGSANRELLTSQAAAHAAPVSRCATKWAGFSARMRLSHTTGRAPGQMD